MTTKLFLSLFSFFIIVGTAYSSANLVGPSACIECHKQEGAAWQTSHHFTSYNAFHRKKEVKGITKKLGIRRVKSESLCLTCHYTVTVKQGKKKKKLKPVAGISCESCHGPAKKWMPIHNNYGGKKVTKAQETPAHKKSRMAKSLKAGMIHPKDIYSVASNCFSCHSVPHPKLVEVGGHKAGSDFELVSWSQGEVRHSYLNSSDKKNRMANAARKRVMFVAGRILDVEYGIRGLAKAKGKGAYLKAMVARVNNGIKNLQAVAKASGVAEISSIISIAKAVKKSAGAGKAQKAAAKKISGLAKKALANSSIESKSALDALIPTKLKGSARP